MSATDSLNKLIQLLQIVVSFRLKHVKQRLFIAHVLLYLKHVIDLSLMIVILLQISLCFLFFSIYHGYLSKVYTFTFS